MVIIVHKLHLSSCALCVNGCPLTLLMWITTSVYFSISLFCLLYPAWYRFEDFQSAIYTMHGLFWCPPPPHNNNKNFRNIFFLTFIGNIIMMRTCTMPICQSPSVNYIWTVFLRAFGKSALSGTCKNKSECKLTARPRMTSPHHAASDDARLGN